ncbi:MAG: N-acetylmuramoyl-L-alanine amidase [Chthoniobacterales bacterium]|nr:N-acetylmuramoyl-L-alanine amidase [Chthoniobacterales bacterium]
MILFVSTRRGCPHGRFGAIHRYSVATAGLVFYGSPMRRVLKPLVAVLLASVLAGCAGGGHIGGFRTVVVDAGHGGIDKGARGVDGSLEKKYTLDTAKRIERGLRSKGYRVIMTRKGDYFVPLPTRAAISNRQRGAIFVSVHYNDAPRSAPNGTETYYFNSRSYPLAAHIQRELARISYNRGVKTARFHVLRNNARPAVLVELGFLSNPTEARRIRSAGYRQRLADAVVRGVSKSSR